MSDDRRLIMMLVGFWSSGFGFAVNLATLIRGMPPGMGRAVIAIFLIFTAVCSFLIGNQLLALYRGRAVDESDPGAPDIV